MKNLVPYLLLVILFGGASCSETPSPVAAEQVNPPPKPDTCRIEVQTLTGNRYTDFIAAEKVILRAPIANEWQLEVYDLYTCLTKAVYNLPANDAPDYPYFLADLNYNNSGRKVGIRGHRHIFVADLDRETLSNPIQPQYPANRLAEPESGSIQHLEVWEDYLIGTTTDWGAFVFKLDSLSPKPIVAAAELVDGEQFHSLFLIGTRDGKYQAIIPNYNLDEGIFSVNPLFEQPTDLIPTETVYAAGSPYARVKEPSGAYIGIDLRTGELLPVIEEKVPN